MLQKDLEFKEYLKLISNLPRVFFALKSFFLIVTFYSSLTGATIAS